MLAEETRAKRNTQNEKRIRTCRQPVSLTKCRKSVYQYNCHHRAERGLGSSEDFMKLFGGA